MTNDDNYDDYDNNHNNRRIFNIVEACKFLLNLNRRKISRVKTVYTEIDCAMLQPYYRQ
jgi:hypothetical protein